LTRRSKWGLGSALIWRAGQFEIGGGDEYKLILSDGASAPFVEDFGRNQRSFLFSTIFAAQRRVFGERSPILAD
jgi:hypothetical protein